MKRFLFILLLGFLFTSCARVGSPVGGSRDSIPPQVIGSNIDSPRTNVPRNIKELRIDFDEYINLKEISRQLIISPPIKKITKILPSGIANKFLLIKWDDTLQENTTYNFNFGNAIVDNNEGNALAYYNFAFSTGEKIDSLYISGDVKKLLTDTEKGGETKNIVVGLYQEKDSMDYRQKPYYITMADPDGYFELNYLAPGKYRVLAFEDSNANSVYDPGKEQVAFQSENVNLDKSISGLQLSLVPSQKSNKYLEMKEVPGGILMTFEGNPEKIEVLSLNEKLEDYKITHAPKSDSVFVWFNAKQQNIGIESNENLKFSYDNGIKQDTVSVFYRYNTKNEMLLSNARGNLLPPQKVFVIRSNYYINEIAAEKWTLSSDSIQQNFTAEISKENPFEIHVKSNFAEGKKYSLSIPKETVSSFYESVAKSYRFDFEADKTENYGSFTLTLVNVPLKKFWTQLIASNGEVAYSKYGTESNISFSALKPEKYQLRILVDENENGVWDKANFAENIFAEPVYSFDKAVEVRPLWEIKETWTLPPNGEKPDAVNPEKMPEKPVINKP
jgi:uncharacterized protein (DUF2141 family)